MVDADDGRDGIESDVGWISVSDLAKLKGVSKQAVAKRVDRFVAQGMLQPRPGPRGTKLINLAEFDRAAHEMTDLVRHENGVRSQSGVGDPILAREQARRAAYDADLKKLDLEERLGQLVRRSELEPAIAKCAEAIVSIIDHLPNRADDIAAAMTRDGASGLRALLKGISFEMRETISRRMGEIADVAPRHDEAATTAPA